MYNVGTDPFVQDRAYKKARYERKKQEYEALAEDDTTAPAITSAAEAAMCRAQEAYIAAMQADSESESD